MKITVTHHPRTGEAWTLDPARTYEQHPDHKPQGLWLSVDDDWRRWCEDEGWNVPLAEPVAFTLDTERCLWLSTPGHIDEFSKEYGDDTYLAYVDWQRVADEYAGIVIAPYIWERRLTFDRSRWYYGWDCASACVWDLSCLVSQ